MSSVEYEEIFKIVLNQLNQNINKNIVFWGASLFLKEFIEKHDLKNYKILGIVDNDVKKNNSVWGGYRIYHYTFLENISDVAIVFTIKNNCNTIYSQIKNIIDNKIQNKKIRLLPNVFKEYLLNLSNNLDFSVNSELDIKKLGFKYIYPSETDVEYYKEIEKELANNSEMIPQDNLFLISLLNQYKPKKILEVGVSKGGSSLVILNTIKNINDAKLYSLDYSTEHYTINGAKTGFIIDNYPHLKKKWELYTGGLSLEFMDKISSSTDYEQKFDFCLLDTMHMLPGEVLDFLQILPYLKNNAIIILHDVNLHLNRFEDLNREKAYSSNVLFSALHGEKILPYFKPFRGLFGEFFSNIGAIEFNKENPNYFELFNLLTLKWQYLLKEKDIDNLKIFIKTHYGKYYSEYFSYLSILQAALY